MTVHANQTAARSGKESTPLIQSVQVLTSGTASMHQEHRYGSHKPQLWWVLTSKSWVKAPINYFLIKHRDGPVLFDAGLDPKYVSDPRYIKSAVGRFLSKKIFKFDLTAEDRLDRVLERAGEQAARIRTAVFSHLHFDHVGGIDQIPQAELLVSEQEWAQLSNPHPEREWIFSEYIKTEDARWHPVAFTPSNDPLFAPFAGIHDVAGDGSMILLPTPGHTLGSMSMLIRQDGWTPILLVGDLMYEAAFLDTDTMPGTGDTETLKKTFAKVRHLKEQLPGLVIVPSHDATAAETIDQATRTAAANSA